MKTCLGLLMWVVILAVSGISTTRADEMPVNIGVLAFRSVEKTQLRWSATARALEQAIPGHSFKIVPMNYPQVNQAVAYKTIDFVLTNTGHYVELETAHGIARVATLVKSVDHHAIKVFGGVVFARADRQDIQTISDLKGKRFLAVKRSSLGGFLVAWELFEKNKIDPFSDFESLDFNGMPHDDVVLRVVAGDYDAGTVRTSVLEQMIKEGDIQKGDIKIIHEQVQPDFPYVHSTGLYPEWPFSRLSHTDDDLAEKVTVALLNIHREHPAAIAGGYDRWSPPLDYSAVHAMFKRLKTGPYESLGKFTFQDVFKQYAKEILILFFLFTIGTIALIRIVSLNRSLKKAYSEVQILQGLIPICSSCKKIRDDKGFWNQLETYIEKHSHAMFSHSICPSCTDKLYGDEPWYHEIAKKK